MVFIARRPEIHDSRNRIPRLQQLRFTQNRPRQPPVQRQHQLPRAIQRRQDRQRRTRFRILQRSHPFPITGWTPACARHPHRQPRARQRGLDAHHRALQEHRVRKIVLAQKAGGCRHRRCPSAQHRGTHGSRNESQATASAAERRHGSLLFGWENSGGMPAPKKDPTDGLDALRRRNATVSSRMPLSGSPK